MKTTTANNDPFRDKPRRPRQGAMAGLTPEEAAKMAEKLRRNHPGWTATELEEALQGHGMSGNWTFQLEAYRISRLMYRLTEEIHALLATHGRDCKCPHCQLFPNHSADILEDVDGFRWTLEFAYDRITGDLHPTMSGHEFQPSPSQLRDAAV